jgi:hypothetical protein
MSTPPLSSDERYDPTRRRLCPDGACVGLLDESDRCKVCGRVDPTAPVVALDGAPTEAPDDADEAEELAAAAADASDAGAFDTNRRLCPDGACVGVIGPDGRCGECGRTAEA